MEWPAFNPDTAAGFALLALYIALREGWPFLKGIWQQRSADQQVQAELAKQGYVAVIARLDDDNKCLEAEVSSLRAECKAVSEAERLCAIKTAVLEERVRELEAWKLRRGGSDAKPTGGNP